MIYYSYYSCDIELEKHKNFITRIVKLKQGSSPTLNEYWTRLANDIEFYITLKYLYSCTIGLIKLSQITL